MGNQIIPVESNSLGFLAPVANLIDLKARYDLFKDFVHSILTEKTDYGVIPGTGDKPTLLKPGAEKLLTLFGLSCENVPAEIIEDWTGKDHGGEIFLYYRYRTIVSKNGRMIASAEGSATSWEGKYRYRNADLKCPICGKAAIKLSKFPPRNNPNGKPGYYCYARIGGCGEEFQVDDKRITDQPRGKIPNDNPADLANTLSKMAQKRSMVAATLIAANASDFFTQDLDDMSGLRDDAIPGEFRDMTPPEEPKGNGSTTKPPASSVIPPSRTPEPAHKPTQPPKNPADRPDPKRDFRMLAVSLHIQAKEAEKVWRDAEGDPELAASALRQIAGSLTDETPEGDKNPAE